MVETTTQSIEKRLKVEPILLNCPVGSSTSLSGIIDLVGMQWIDYSQDEMGKMVSIEAIEKGHKLFE